MAVLTGCGEGSISGKPGAEGSGAGEDGGNRQAVDSADEIIKIADLGFVAFNTGADSGYRSDYLSYGFVVENVSDKVALTVRVETDFFDKAGKPVDARAGNDFHVILPGQQLGAGGVEHIEEKDIPADMKVRVSLIGSLDTPDGRSHRNPPAPYAEVTTASPVASRVSGGGREKISIDVTNPYDIGVTPKVTAVVRDAEGKIVGGGGVNSMDEEIPPGGTARTEITRDTRLERIAEGTVEFYADPQLGWIISRDPVWENLVP